VALSGEAAIQMLEEATTPFVGVVSDVVMPGMTGTELARVVLDRFPGTGMLLLSGYTAETLDLAEVLARGALFVGKPFSADQLAKAVAQSRRAGRPLA
jgi:CheY-like chemotaxis protein